MYICRITESSELGKLLSGKAQYNLNIVINYIKKSSFQYAVIGNTRHFIDENKIVSRITKHPLMFGRKVDLIQYNNPTEASKYSNILYDVKYDREYMSYILSNYVISKELLIKTLEQFLRDVNLFKENPFHEIYYHAFVYTLLTLADCVDICSDKDVIKLVPVDNKISDQAIMFMIMLNELSSVANFNIDLNVYKRRLTDASRFI